MKPHLTLHVRAERKTFARAAILLQILCSISSRHHQHCRRELRATQIDLQRSETHVRIGSADWVENSSSSVDDKFVSRDRTTIPFDVILRTLTLKSIISVT